MIKLLKHIKLQDYYLRGKLAITMKCKNSNIYKFFEVVNNQFNNLIDKINHLYYSIYPCKGVLLLKEHELELGIPDKIFNIDKDIYKFTYKFPLPFYDGEIISSDFNPLLIRQKDVFVKKYLMNDNSLNGFKTIAGCYGYSIGFKYLNNSNSLQFTYEFPICFQCSKSSDTVRITVYGNPTSIILQKLTLIYNYIKRIDINIEVTKSTDDNIYNPKDYCPCKDF